MIFFQKAEKERILTNSDYNAITFIPKPNKDLARR